MRLRANEIVVVRARDSCPKHEYEPRARITKENHHEQPTHHRRRRTCARAGCQLAGALGPAISEACSFDGPVRRRPHASLVGRKDLGEAERDRLRHRYRADYTEATTNHRHVRSGATPK